MHTLKRIFNGNRDEAKQVSTHATLDEAVKAAAAWTGGEGWGVFVLDGEGQEVDLPPEMRRLGLA